MISIRNRLVITILGALTFYVLLTFSLTFYYFSEELTKVVDDKLQNLAELALSQNLSAASLEDTSFLQRDEMIMVVWQQGVLVYSSRPALAIQPQPTQTGDLTIENKDYQFYQVRTETQQVLFAEESISWLQIDHETMPHFILPSLLSLPFILAFIYLIIGKQLRPLSMLSQKIKARGTHNLRQIDIHNVPVEILPLIQSLNNLLARLKNSLNLQRQFTADAAHELRTPLTAINLQLDILERTDDEEERKEVEGDLREAVNREKNLVEDLLLLARHETDTLDSAVEETDIMVSIDAVLQRLAPIVQSKQHTIQVNSTTESTTLLAHPHNIHVMLENILENAVKYTQPEGHIEITVSSGHHGIQLTIADNGPGIPEDEQARVFDRFYRCEHSHTIGTGLGLSIAKNIIEHYQGSIEVKSGKLTTGCTVIIELPMLTQ